MIPCRGQDQLAKRSPLPNPRAPTWELGDTCRRGRRETTDTSYPTLPKCTIQPCTLAPTTAARTTTMPEPPPRQTGGRRIPTCLLPRHHWSTRKPNATARTGTARSLGRSLTHCAQSLNTYFQVHHTQLGGAARHQPWTARKRTSIKAPERPAPEQQAKTEQIDTFLLLLGYYSLHAASERTRRGDSP